MAGVSSGKVALVTGGSSGIGRATALAFARDGAKVVIADIQVEKGQDVVAQIEAAGGEATFLEIDVSKSEQVRAMVRQTVGAYGRLDYAFNNAGVEGQIRVKTADLPVDEWDTLLATDLTGVFLCMKAEIPQMLSQGGGAIVNMSSIAGMVGDVMIGAAYHASKFGVIGLTKTAALEYATQNLRINAVLPGFIDTPMVEAFFGDDAALAAKKLPTMRQTLSGIEPLRRLGRPEEVAGLVTWLCSDAASFVTGGAYPVDGGILAQ